jgi:hypothetical protein
MNDKQDILTIVHIDNFLFKRIVDFLHHKVEIVEHRNIDDFILMLNDKISDIIYMTERPEYKYLMNDKLKKLNIYKICSYCDNIIEIIKNINCKMVLIGNNNIHKYDIKLDVEIKNKIIININNYKMKYNDGDMILNNMRDLFNLINLNKKNICDMFDETHILEQMQMIKEDKYNYLE